MATKAAAFNSWASSFGMPAYASSSVPEDASLPYVTYDFGAGMWGEAPFACTLNLWTAGSEADANARAEAVGASLGLNGKLLPCDGGALWLTRGEPFWQAVADEDGVKRRYINVTVESLTVS